MLHGGQHRHCCHYHCCCREGATTIKNSSSDSSRKLTSNTSDGTEANVQVNAAEDVCLRLVDETFRLEEARLFGCLFIVSKKKMTWSVEVGLWHKFDSGGN